MCVDVYAHMDERGRGIDGHRETQRVRKREREREREEKFVICHFRI